MSSTTETAMSLRAFRVGDWLVEPSLNRLSRGDATVRLDVKSMDLLLCLVEHAGEVVPTRRLVDRVWRVEAVAVGTLTHAMAELRKALGDDAREPTYIETVPKRGYRLIAPVTLDEVEGAGEEPASRRPLARWRLLIPVAALLLVVLPLVVWRTRQAPSPEATPPEPQRIVVLPFINLGAPEDENFADGITSELISRLSVVSNLEVISTTSSMSYKGANRLIGDIGRQLGVDYALEGEVRWERPGEGPGRVRITPQLIRVADDTHLWNAQYDRDIDSIFEVQSEIAEQVIAHLRVRLFEPEQRAIEARPTDNMDAYNAYLRGLDRLDAPGPGDIELAIAMFERAVELDPEFALPYAALSNVHSMAYAFRSDLDPERLAEAKRDADRALELDPNLPEGHVALGVFYELSRDSERALAQYRAALALRPNLVEALARTAMVERRRGRWQEAVDLLQRAAELDPRNDVTLNRLAWTYMLLRRYPEAVDSIGRAISIAPDNAGHYSLEWLIELAWHGPSGAKEVLEEAIEIIPALAGPLCVLEMELRNYEAAAACFDATSGQVGATVTVYLPVAYFESECHARMGEPDLARQKLEQALALLEEAADVSPEDPAVRISLGRVFAALGRKEDAIREGERAVAMQPVSEDAVLGTIHLMYLAEIYARVGELEAAVDRIEYLLTIPSELSVARIRNSPTWDPLRDHPRFQEILEKYGEDG
jgi:serine/threonine-protein kinase